MKRKERKYNIDGLVHVSLCAESQVKHETVDGCEAALELTPHWEHDTWRIKPATFSSRDFDAYTAKNALTALPPPKEDSVVHGCLSEFAKRTHDILFRSLKGLVCSRV